jgi:hypothetical protein
MLLQSIALASALILQVSAWASAPACSVPSFESAIDPRYATTALQEPCSERPASLIFALANPFPFAPQIELLEEPGDPYAPLAFLTATETLASESIGTDAIQPSPGQGNDVVYGDNGAIYGWVARITGGARSARREALDHATRGWSMPVLGGGPTAQILALGVLVAAVSVRRRQTHRFAA